MAKKEIIEELRAKLGEDRQANAEFLKKETERFIKEGNSEGIEAAGELILENMPKAQKDEIERLTNIDGESLDGVFKKIVDFINEKKPVEAKPLAEKLYKKIITDYAPTEKSQFVSFRNPFEDNLYQIKVKTEKTLTRTPFDFAEYITTYGYLLVETGSPLDAIPVLEKAIEYNPVDCGPRFELAEVYKLLKNKRMVINTTKDTLKIASSPVAIARCYANMGYILTDMGEYEDAVAFYTASIIFAPHPMIPHELRHVAQLKGSPAVQPTMEQMQSAMAKYDIEFGPDREVVSVAAQLAWNYLNENDIPNALKALKLTYNLTRDEEIKKTILKYEPNADRLVPNQEKIDEE
ncbi:MAG: tetratricopeptide repeat protein [Ruminococcus sp.]|nr:tetratricopeptide repeat protein [Ruminococcus sp.]